MSSKIKEKFDLDRVSEKLDNLVGVLGKLGTIANMVPDLLLKGGVAYAGAAAFGEHDQDAGSRFNLMGAVVGLLGLELAKSSGLVSSIAGIATLTGIGIANMNPSSGDIVQPGPVGGDGIPLNFKQFQPGRTG